MFLCLPESISNDPIAVKKYARELRRDQIKHAVEYIVFAENTVNSSSYLNVFEQRDVAYHQLIYTDMRPLYTQIYVENKPLMGYEQITRERITTLTR